MIALMILDGAALARARLPELMRRSAAVAAERGRPPRLAVLATARQDAPPAHVGIKVRAAEAAGVATEVIALPPDADTGDVLARLRSIDPAAVDAIFVQFPLPDRVDEAEVFDAIPPVLDVDVLSSDQWRRFEDGAGRAPATAAAAMALFDVHRVRVAGRTAVVVGEESALARAFELLLARRGGVVRERIPADTADLAARLAAVEIVILLAGRPGAVRAAALPASAVVVDGGYFNPRGVGDLDARAGVGHLAALIPVPGGLGPMTVSVLLERTIANAGG